MLQFDYEDILRRFYQQLDDLQTRLLEMGGLVESAIHNSVTSLAGRDEARARTVLGNEPRIDRLELEIDDFAMRLLALNQPMARDMRFLAAAIKINKDLERMGDLAAHIADRSISLMSQPPLPLWDIPRLGELAAAMLRDSLDSLVRQDAALAERVLQSDAAVDRLRDALYYRLIGAMQEDASAVESDIHLLFVVRHLERIADHATNIGEDVLFYLRGVDVRHQTALAG